MSQKRHFYITTPIYYVNDHPHIGHAYTTVAADAAARYHRMKGEDVMFLTGTDEHGQKVLRAALARGRTPQQHVDELVRPFQELWKRLLISNDDFIRTSEPRHHKVVQAVLQRLYDEGLIYASSYSGWYSTSEERFWTEKEVVDGKDPVSGQPVEWIKEENYFFRMGSYQRRLVEYIETHPEFLRPESRRNEVLGYLRQPLDDLCISRPKSRMSWGIELPFDREYVTYVWFDALLNYLTAIGYLADGNEGQFERFWPASFHFVGKDILTTHAVYWSTMLFALGLEPSRCLYAHGWWTIEGQKMSKSLKNVVDPNLLLDAYGADAVRYFLLREVPFGLDGDFGHRAFQLRYNADLANDLGNLVHRALSMTERWLEGRIPARSEIAPQDELLERLAVETVSRTDEAMEGVQFHQALGAIWALVQAGNKYIDTEQPWSLNRDGRSARLGTVLRNVLEVCRITGVLLAPFCPSKSVELLAKLGTTLPSDLGSLVTFDRLEEGLHVMAGEPLFPRMMALPPAIQAALDREIQAVAPNPVTSTPRRPMENPTKTPTETPTDKTTENATEIPATSTITESAIPQISYEDFSRVRLVIGHVKKAEKHPKADKLLVLEVDCGQASPRTIVAGIADRYHPDELVGQQIVVVLNLKPVKLRGIQSDGMLLAAGLEGVKGLLTVKEPVPAGTSIK
jgi:methionyl-tRNA synthetase